MQDNNKADKYGKNSRIIGRKSYRDSVGSATTEHGLRLEQRQLKHLHFHQDPRSPTHNINRTPIVCNEKFGESSGAHTSGSIIDSPLFNGKKSWKSSTPIQTFQVKHTEQSSNIDPHSPTCLADLSNFSSDATFYSCESIDSLKEDFENKLSLKLHASSAGRKFIHRISHGIGDHAPMQRNRIHNQKSLLTNRCNTPAPLDLRCKRKLSPPKRLHRTPFSCLRNRSKSLEEIHTCRNNYQSLKPKTQDDSLHYQIY